MSAWELPRSLEIGGSFYRIRSDFRAVLDTLAAFRDPDLEEDERWMVCFEILFEDPVPPELFEEAARKAMWFINCGQDEPEDAPKRPSVMDWEDDGHMIIPAVNKVAGMEVRAVEYLHWWTFIGYYMEINEGLFSTVISIRQKKAKGKNLEKWERQFVSENKELFRKREKMTEEEKEEKARLKAKWGF